MSLILMLQALDCWWLKMNWTWQIGSGSHSDAWGIGDEVVPGNSRCCEAIHMGIWGGYWNLYSLYKSKHSQIWIDVPWTFFIPLNWIGVWYIAPVIVGSQEQTHWEYIDIVRGSSLPNGLYGLCAGMQLIP